MKEISDPFERQVADLFNSCEIKYTFPEHEAEDPTTLDFYLPDYKTYIEVKQFHTDRIAEQLSHVPQHLGAIVLVGKEAVKSFCQMVLK